MFYLAVPYWHRNKLVRAARFAAGCELMKMYAEKDIPVFCDAVYIHTLLESNPEMEYSKINWWKVLKPFRKMADNVVVYQIPGWDKDALLVNTYRFFTSNGEQVSCVASNVKHITGPFLEAWNQV